ncbi:MAG: type II secretion system secretin GspD [Nitrospinota bacterium]|nr:type II secretion system secretin GspD [Nitrospinota bacterium]
MKKRERNTMFRGYLSLAAILAVLSATSTGAVEFQDAQLAPPDQQIQGSHEGIGAAADSPSQSGQVTQDDQEQSPEPEPPAVVQPSLPSSSGPAGKSRQAGSGAIPKPSASGLVSLDFNDVDIKLFIKAISESTGKNFVVDEQVKGKVTIISPKEVKPREAYRVFESTLGVYGYALVESGEVIKIVPSVEAKQMGPFGMGAASSGDKLVTRLIPLKYSQGQNLLNVLRPLLPVTSFINFHQDTNTLIIVDLASNVEKLRAIIEQLDAPGQEEMITVRRLTYSGAKEMADKMLQLFNKGGLLKRNIVSPTPPGMAPAPAPGVAMGSTMGDSWGQTQPQVIPDDRINAIIIVAGKQMTDKLLALVDELDQPAPSGQGKINVYYLKNADAEELAKVLSNMVTGASPTPAQPGRPPMAPAPPPPGTGSGMTLQGAITVTPDKSTNSLVITASKEDYLTLRDVIELLDKRRRQVFVEALIMEVTTDKQRQFGIEWRTTSDFTKKGAQAIGGTNFGSINAVAENPFNAPQGLAIGVVDGIINFAGKEFLNLGALLHALQTETGVNILSTPNILTTDNEKAEIVVAQNVPFVTGQSQNTGGTTLTTIERKNIGITLRIKPQISEADIVKLAVYQEISSISPVQLEKAQDLITFTRSVDTTVVVSDGQNVVIGGLIRDDLNDVENKVPILGDIPLLGWLFKYKSKQKQKTNLLVFLTPHIIHNDDQMRQLIEQRRERLNLSGEEGEFSPAITDKANPRK